MSVKYNQTGVLNFLHAKKLLPKSEIAATLNQEERFNFQQAILQDQIIDTEIYKAKDIVANIIESKDNDELQGLFEQAKISESKYMISGWHVFKHQIPYWVFIIISIVMCYYCYTKSFSLIPVLGMLCCLYMMSEIGLSNWVGFTIWLLVGLLVYFGYSIKHSKLRHSK